MTAERPNGTAPLTIAAVATATGISEHTLRAWERRYGIPAPVRSPCRYRLYNDRDVALIDTMRRLIARGVKPSVAADRARSEMDRCPADLDVPRLRDDLLAALLREDEPAAGQLFTTAVEALNPCRLVAEVIRPVLHDVGAGWAAGAVGVDVEHFASAALRSRLEALTTRTEPPAGRLALLTCAPGERHELPIICLRLNLANHGWRSHVLGCDLPACNLIDAVRRHRPAMVAISVTRSSRLRDAIEAATRVREAAPGCAVVIGGQGVGSTPLPQDVGGEAEFWALIETPAVSASAV